MNTIQPPFISKYFINKKNRMKPRLGKQIYKQFYLSWEDALWHLLKIHHLTNTQQTPIILVPEFFCGDVVINMKNHGLKPITYAINKQLQPSVSDFIQKIKTYNPSIVVIFHAVGITNPLMTQTKKWLPHLDSNCILIEDCVHRVIDQNKLKFYTKQHYCIDSLRKVVPIQGSWLYSSQPIEKLKHTTAATKIYSLLVLFWWIVMQFFLIVAYYMPTLRTKKIANILAEFAMKAGYDVIGDNQDPSAGNWMMAQLSEHLNRTLIYAEKIKQAELYAQLLTPLFASNNTKSKLFFKIPIPATDYSQLRGFPVGVELQTADKFLTYAREHNLITRFELDDCDWSKKQKIIYLPMGIHVTAKNIDATVQVLIQFLTLPKSQRSTQ